MQASTRLKLTRGHRVVGMLASVPIVCWIVSSFVLHGVGLALPNGLQGVYELTPFHARTVSLEDVSLTPPDSILGRLAEEGIERIYWLRLDVLAGKPVYVAKLGPFELERVFDAHSGRSLDPLPDDMLYAIADEHLVGTTAQTLQHTDEFNRYYAVESVPAVEVHMAGDQPSELVFSRASGRVLRRTDPLAEWFHAAYRSVHVWQWGDSVRWFSALLYALVGTALLLVSLGYVLWWTRRATRRRWTGAVRRARRSHATIAPLAGLLLSTQMLVGAYLWFNLGLIEPRFRGQGSFRVDWEGGVRTSESLATPSAILAAASEQAASGSGRAASLRIGGHPIQRYEWRAIGERRFWLVYPTRDDNGVLVDAGTGAVLDRLPPDLAADAGAEVVAGVAEGAGVESTEYWMDFNRRVPTYRFRFTDPDDTDVHVSQVTGEVVQRRPAIWRSFGPFLLYHTFGFTGNPWVDTVLLTLLQAVILVMVATGWAMALPRGRGGEQRGAGEGDASAV